MLNLELHYSPVVMFLHNALISKSHNRSRWYKEYISISRGQQTLKELFTCRINP